MKLIGSFIFIFLMCTTLFGAQAQISKTSVVMGEQIVLVLKASGSDVEFPEISAIESYEITSTGMQQNIEYINGTMNKKLEKHYAFSPLKSIDIPSFTITVDGKKEHTKPLHVKVTKADIKNSPFILEVKVPKTNVMQFEAVPLEIIFKMREDIKPRELRMATPKYDNFWVKEGKKSQPEQKDGFIIQKMNMFLFPQKAGDYELAPTRIDVALQTQSRDIFNMLSNQVAWKSVFSNALSLHVNELKGANLYGDFDISLDVDKNEIEQNQGINATLKITGSGNFDNIDAYAINIAGANIYADKPVIKTQGIVGEFTQKFSISANKDFVIPSLEVKYFDAKSQKILTKKTEPLSVHVKNTAIESSLQIGATKEVVVQKENSYFELILAFIAGISFTLVVVVLFYYLSKKEYILPKFKNDKDLLKAMLKHRGKSQELDEQISALEENLYANGKNKINKKILSQFI